MAPRAQTGRLAASWVESLQECTRLTSVTIPDSVVSIGDYAFQGCIGLTCITIGNSVTSIGESAFSGCSSLTCVVIPDSVASIGCMVFSDCSTLVGVYFKGSAPRLPWGGWWGPCSLGSGATVYYLPGTAGWGTSYGGLPTALWVLPIPLILSGGPNLGIEASGFGFVISWATNDIPIVVDASTDLGNRIWLAVGTNTLSGGSTYFIDPEWTNYPARFYRLRLP